MSKELKNAYATLMYFLTEGVKEGLISSDESDVTGEKVGSYQWFANSLRRHAKLPEDSQMNNIRNLIKFMDSHNMIVEIKEVKK
jgi:hypothetical protein